MINVMDQFDTVANAEAGAKLHFRTAKGDFAFTDVNNYDEEDKLIPPVKPITVTMIGTSSDKYKKFALSKIRQLRAESKGKRKTKGDDQFSDTHFEDTAKAQVERLVCAVTSWENMLDDKQGELKCTPENVAFIFTKYQALRVQAIMFLDDDANFIKS